MDLIESIFRTIFYVIASIIAILTFIKAKNGLLNSVNTECQKKSWKEWANFRMKSGINSIFHLIITGLRIKL